MSLLDGENQPWRSAWLYEYNYETQFPYTPNVRGIRKGDWKYIAYPPGDGSPLKHLEEMYNLAEDPVESRNLVHDPVNAPKLEQMREALAELLVSTGADSDPMPLDEGIRPELPEASIR